MIWQAFISLVVIPCVAVNLAMWGTKIKALIHPQGWSRLRMKPIDCAYCLSFWLNILIQPVDGTLNIIIFALASSVIAKKIEDNL